MHLPVLREEVVKYLEPKSNQHVVDCTVGSAGHAQEILERTGPNGKLLGLDADKDALQEARTRLRKYGKRVKLRNANYAHLEEVVQEEKFHPIHGILLDLGLSSRQLEESERGFSFRRTEPLDMRFDTSSPFTAEKLVNFWNKHQIARVLKEYGEERFAGRIAEAIVRERSKRDIATTAQLVEVISKAVPSWYRRKSSFPQKTFQALRIAVNEELDNLKEVLPQAERLLEQEGRIAVISFHSLEDRIVKNYFRESPSLSIITKKPVIPSEREVRQNPRSRSAKLRAAKKHS